MNLIRPKQITSGNENYVLATTGGTTEWVPLSGISTSVTQLNDLSDVTTGLPLTPTIADDGRMLFYDFDAGQWVTDDTVNHGTVVINAKKSTAGTIAKGTPVYLVGFDSDLHTVETANATSSATMPVIGLAGETLDDTNNKHVITFGKITGIDTTSASTIANGEVWVVNDDLYVDTATGELTNVRPTGASTQIQRVAKVLRVHASGGQLFIFNTARTAGLPNLTDNTIWIGNSDNQPIESTLSDALSTTANCISDLYVSKIHSCSPLLINPNDEGDIFIGTSGLTVDIGNSKVGINTTTPTNDFTIVSKLAAGATTFSIRRPDNSLMYSTGLGGSGDAFYNLYNSAASLTHQFHSNSPSYINTSHGLAIGTTSTVGKGHLTIQGAGSTNATTALLVENSSGNDLLDIDDAGNVVFNEDSIDADFRIEGSTDSVLFNLNGGNDNIGIGGTANANTKLYINGSNKPQYTYGLNITGSNGISTGIIATVAKTGNTNGIITYASSSSGGEAKGIYAYVLNTATGTAKGVEGLGGNAITNNYGGYFRTSNSGGVGTNAAVYATSQDNGPVKHGVYTNVGNGDTGTTTIYGFRSLVGTTANDTTIYANHSYINLAGSITGTTGYGMYIQYSNNISDGNNMYGVVVEDERDYSGFGTTTPTETVHIDGSFRYVDGNQADGYVLTSDANGVATWMSGATGGGGTSKYAADVPMTGGTAVTVTHSLGSTDVTVQVKNPAGELITAGVVDNYLSNSVDIEVSVTGTYRVIIIG